jgi:hypothetical protein
MVCSYKSELHAAITWQADAEGHDSYALSRHKHMYTTPQRSAASAGDQ